MSPHPAPPRPWVGSIWLPSEGGLTVRFIDALVGHDGDNTYSPLS